MRFERDVAHARLAGIAPIAASTNSRIGAVERNEAVSDSCSNAIGSTSGSSLYTSARWRNDCSAALKKIGSVPWKPKIACL